MLFRKFFLYSCCIILVVGFFVSVIYSQLLDAFQLVMKESELAQQIENELAKQGELYKKADYYETDEFIEQIAREQLGFIRHDEIIFIREK